ncbi:MAG: hypothetical protein MJZ19_02230 [Paludibacteraceae bacterium]|nr:hypothetical protein [Paludibacteraceae bacterium]
MKKFLAIMLLFLSSVLFITGCKSGCGCHGDPFGELPAEVENSDIA